MLIDICTPDHVDSIVLFHYAPLFFLRLLSYITQDHLPKVIPPIGWDPPTSIIDQKKMLDLKGIFLINGK